MPPRTKNFAINMTALIGAVLGVTGWAIRSSALAIDARYVHTDAFVLSRQRDSLTSASDKRDILRLLAGLDSSDRCRRHQTEFCR